MGNPSVLISIETTAKTEEKSFGTGFMQALIDEDRRLVPEVVSLSEKFKDPFIDVQHFVDEWWAMPIKTYVNDQPTGERFGGPLWKRKTALASRGMINHGLVNKKNQKVPANLWFESRWKNDLNFEHLFEKWVSLSRPSIGMLHVFGDIERNANKSADSSSFAVGSFGGPAKPGIPNIGWGMAYGEEYASEVDCDRIINSGFIVRRISGTVIVQVTDNISDVVNDYARFAERRAQLKSLFRPGLFWIDNEIEIA